MDFRPGDPSENSDDYEEERAALWESIFSGAAVGFIRMRLSLFPACENEEAAYRIVQGGLEAAATCVNAAAETDDDMAKIVSYLQGLVALQTAQLGLEVM